MMMERRTMIIIDPARSWLLVLVSQTKRTCSNGDLPYAISDTILSHGKNTRHFTIPFPTDGIRCSDHLVRGSRD